MRLVKLVVSAMLSAAIKRQYSSVLSGWLGSLVVGCWTRDREIAGSTPGRRTAG